MDWIEANGVSLRYELDGRRGDIVVLMHEMGGALESWDDSLAGFQQHFRTLRYDQRGCGQSEKVRGRLRLDDMVGDITGLLDALGIAQPCHVVGSALGAGIAMALAARHPGRVARLAISSPVTGATAARGPLQAQRAATVEREGMRSYVTRSLDTSYPEALRSDRARFERYRCRWLANDPYCHAAMDRMKADMALTEELGHIACPTLVLGATHDTQRPPAFVQSVTQQIRGARYVELDSGHLMHVQTPGLFVQRVVPFLLGA